MDSSLMACAVYVLLWITGMIAAAAGATWAVLATLALLGVLVVYRHELRHARQAYHRMLKFPG